MRIPILLLFIAFVSLVNAQTEGSITENIREGSFRLAPNPVQDRVTLLPAETDKHLFVLFYDPQGRNVMSTDVRGNTSVDVSDLPAGAYMVSTVNERGTTLDVHRLFIAR